MPSRSFNEGENRPAEQKSAVISYIQVKISHTVHGVTVVKNKDEQSALAAKKHAGLPVV